MVRAPTTTLAALSSTSQRINCIVCFSLLLLATATQAIKFDLEASSSPHIKCIWNYALSDSLVIITINTAIPNGSSSKDENDQRVDVEIVDGSKHNNIYLSKKNIRKETRMAINTHSHADLGVCVKNSLKKGACGTECAVAMDSLPSLTISPHSPRLQRKGPSDHNRLGRRHWSRRRRLQRHCQPGVTLRPRDGNEEARGNRR